MAVVTLEEVDRGKPLSRFVELPQWLHGADPRFAPLVLAWERFRVDHHRNPALHDTEVQLLLARRAGRPAGRVAAHVPPDGRAEGRFGLWCTVEDRAVAEALLEGARRWLDGQGCRAMVGPVSFDPADEPGALVAGFDVAGTTGRPWRPPWEAGHLEALGGWVADEVATWRLAAEDLGVSMEATGPLPGQAGPHADPRLALGPVTAVPDLSPALRHTGLRGAWALARRVRAGAWEGCTVVRCDGPPAGLVPGLVTAASRAGYRWVVAPWAPGPGLAPETRHRTYRFSW